MTSMADTEVFTEIPGTDFLIKIRKTKVALTQRFELQGSTYTQFFFNKYIWYYKSIFSSL